MIKKQKALIVGGSNGIGLALAMRLVKEKSVLIVDKVEPDYSQVPSDIKHLVSFRKFDLLFDDYSLFDEFKNLTIGLRGINKKLLQPSSSYDWT